LSGSGSQVSDDLAEHAQRGSDLLETGRKSEGGVDLGLGELLEWQRTDHIGPVGEGFRLPIVLLAGHIVASFVAARRDLVLDAASMPHCVPPAGRCLPNQPAGQAHPSFPGASPARICRRQGRGINHYADLPVGHVAAVARLNED
jgi:hypothetical protein